MYSLLILFSILPWIMFRKKRNVLVLNNCRKDRGYWTYLFIYLFENSSLNTKSMHIKQKSHHIKKPCSPTGPRRSWALTLVLLWKIIVHCSDLKTYTIVNKLKSRQHNNTIYMTAQRIKTWCRHSRRRPLIICWSVGISTALELIDRRWIIVWLISSKHSGSTNMWKRRREETTCWMWLRRILPSSSVTFESMRQAWCPITALSSPLSNCL